MLLGILSDTHGNLPAMTAAMRLLRAANAQYFIHCGDVGTEEILHELAGSEASFIFGNNDWDTRPLESCAAAIGIRCLGRSGSVALAGKQIAVTHGDDGPLLNHLVSAQQHDYILLGHSHVAGEKCIGRTRLINPGALFRARQKTVALLDLATDTLQWIVVPDQK